MNLPSLQGLQGFPGFPGFLSECASSHPDKLRVQTNLTEIKEDFDITTELYHLREKLKQIETPEYRAKVDKDTIESKRKKYTLMFKTLLMAKESQNTK
jgi:hypothetical protein